LLNDPEKYNIIYLVKSLIMVKDEEISRLKFVGLFDGLETAALQDVYKTSRFEKRAEGEYFFFQGDPADSVFVLVEGQVRLLQLTPDGQQIILRIITPDTLFGVIGAVKGATFPVTAESMANSRALCWPHELLLQLMSRYPQIAQNAMQSMAGHVQEMQDRYREMATERVERRVARTILRLTRAAGKRTEEGIEITIPLTRQDLAEMSGTTLFTVSRIVSEWERNGIVRAGRERLLILQPHGLVKIAEDLA
jgi:CRP/FNR family transcriptional regulator, nitrogen oxide reductase regulator